MSLRREVLEGGVLRLTLDRPKAANALDGALHAALVEALEAAERDAAIRAVLLAGAGGRVFSAGADLREELGADARRLRREWLLHSLLAVLDCPKPLLAVIHGKAVGGGAMLALLADEVLMGHGAALSMPEIAIGMPSPLGIEIIARRGGRAAAQALVQGGAPMDATAALAARLADAVHATEELDDAALARARQLGALDARAYAANKAWMNAALRVTMQRAADHAASLAMKETGHAH
jgi:enoyl-CoA hydratase/carnithine racemase